MYTYPLCPWGHRGEETKQLTTVTLIQKKKNAKQRMEMEFIKEEHV